MRFPEAEGWQAGRLQAGAERRQSLRHFISSHAMHNLSLSNVGLESAFTCPVSR